MLFGFGFTEVLSIIFIIWADFFVGIYTTSAAVATYEVESAALRGMGKSLEPSVVTILGTVVFRMIWMVTVFRWIPTYEMLMNVYIASWIFTGGVIFVIYFWHMRKIER